MFQIMDVNYPPSASRSRTRTRLSAMSIEETQQSRKSTCNHGRAIKHVAGGNKDHRGSSSRPAQTTHATRPTGGGAGWRGRAAPEHMAARCRARRHGNRFAWGKGQGGRVAHLGSVFSVRGRGGSSTMRPKLRVRRSKPKRGTRRGNHGRIPRSRGNWMLQSRKNRCTRLSA